MSRTASTPARRTDVVVHELDGEALIYDPQSGDTHRLNATAAFIWRHCDGHTDAEAMTRRMTDTYEVEYDCALQHTGRMLSEFAAAGLLTPIGNRVPGESDEPESDGHDLGGDACEAC